MYWLTAVGYGAVGGAVVEAINFFGLVTALQQSRSEAQRQRGELPKLREQFDVSVNILVALSRLGLGAFAGFIFHEQISGPYAAVVVGAAAPAILKQLNAVPSIRAAAIGPADSERPQPETKATAERFGQAAPAAALPEPYRPELKPFALPDLPQPANLKLDGTDSMEPAE